MDHPRTLIAWVYVLECGDGTLYTGATKNLDRRVATHSAGKGARYTRSRLPVRLVYSEAIQGDFERSAWRNALRREYQIKQLTRAGKIVLIQRGLQTIVQPTDK